LYETLHTHVGTGCTISWSIGLWPGLTDLFMQCQVSLLDSCVYLTTVVVGPTCEIWLCVLQCI